RGPVLLALDRAGEAIHVWQVYFTVTNADLWDVESLRGIARAFRAAGRDREADDALQRAAAVATRSAGPARTTLTQRP
ncbi:MAG TPA: hypothetical protein VMS88_04365, partial [Terriglobales bacterium]|nr:hypothetical protein [Terriglobales bacterium]